MSSSHSSSGSATPPPFYAATTDDKLAAAERPPPAPTFADAAGGEKCDPPPPPTFAGGGAGYVAAELPQETSPAWAGTAHGGPPQARAARCSMLGSLAREPALLVGASVMGAMMLIQFFVLILCATVASSATGCALGIVLPSLAMCGIVVCLRKWFRPPSQAPLALCMLSLCVLALVLPPTAVIGVYVPFRRELVRAGGVAHYAGPVPTSASPADQQRRFAAASTFFYDGIGANMVVLDEFKAVRRLQTSGRGDLKKESGTFAVAPLVAQGSVEVSAWACACRSSPGCRSFRSVSFSGGKHDRVWNQRGGGNGLRIDSKKIKGFCEQVAYESAALFANATASTPFIRSGAPINGGAVFIELGSFASLRTRLNVISAATAVVFDVVAVLFVPFLTYRLYGGANRGSVKMS